MKYSNRYNWPEYLYDWGVKDEYERSKDPNTLSATFLLKPIRMSVLSIRYGDEAEQDVSDLIASRMGTAIHDSISKVDTINVSKEQRISRQIDINGTMYTITGKYDICTFKDGIWTLRDIKTTSTWTYVFGDGSKDTDYQRQLSIYKWLLSPRQNVNDIAYIDWIFTDWSRAASLRDPAYPQQRIHPGHKIKLMSLPETEQYVRERVTEYDNHRNLKDEDLPECPIEELWPTEQKFAVTKPGAKKATKLCDSVLEAEAYIQANNIKGYIEERPRKIKRCGYCAAKENCSQFRDLQAKGLIQD